MLVYGRKEQWCQLVENFDFYLQAKSKIHASLLFLEILLRYSELVILRALGMPGYNYQKQ